MNQVFNDTARICKIKRFFRFPMEIKRVVSFPMGTGFVANNGSPQLRYVDDRPIAVEDKHSIMLWILSHLAGVEHASRVYTMISAGLQNQCVLRSFLFVTIFVRPSQ